MTTAVSTRPVSLIVNGQPRRVEVAPRRTLAELLREDLGLTGTKIGCNRAECGSCTLVALTKEEVEAEARRVGIPLMPDAMPRDVDLTIDGADEVSPALDLIKGGGGALLREKIVAQASRRVVIVPVLPKATAGGRGVPRAPAASRLRSTSGGSR